MTGFGCWRRPGRETPVRLPIPFLQYVQIRSVALRTRIRLSFFIEKDWRAAHCMSKCIDQHVVSGKVDLDYFMTVVTMGGQKAEAGIVLTHSPADLL
jgi:hypothetical protein